MGILAGHNSAPSQWQIRAFATLRLESPPHKLHNRPYTHTRSYPSFSHDAAHTSIHHACPPPVTLRMHALASKSILAGHPLHGAYMLSLLRAYLVDTAAPERNAEKGFAAPRPYTSPHKLRTPRCARTHLPNRTSKHCGDPYSPRISTIQCTAHTCLHF